MPSRSGSRMLGTKYIFIWLDSMVSQLKLVFGWWLQEQRPALSNGAVRLGKDITIVFFTYEISAQLMRLNIRPNCRLHPQAFYAGRVHSSKRKTTVRCLTVCLSGRLLPSVYTNAAIVRFCPSVWRPLQLSYTSWFSTTDAGALRCRPANRCPTTLRPATAAKTSVWPHTGRGCSVRRLNAPSNHAVSPRNILQQLTRCASSIYDKRLHYSRETARRACQ